MTSINARTLTRVRPQVALPAVADWRSEAVCRDTVSRTWDPWFPKRSGRAAYADARGICSDCPVKAACLADALARSDFGGMRGGLDPVELRALAHAPEPYDGPACRDKVGKTAGYFRHRTAGQEPCDACRLALARDRREKYAIRHARVAS